MQEPLTEPSNADKLDLIAWAVLQLLRKVEKLSEQQQDLDADVTALTTAYGDVQTQTGALVNTTAAIQQEIATLQANNPGVDLTKLDSLAQGAAAATGSLDTAVTSLGALVPPATPPASS